MPRARITIAAAPGRPSATTGPKGRYLIFGEPCWEIIPELTPAPGETIIDKPGYGAFYKTRFDEILREGGIKNLVLTGVTTDCCVTSTLREAEDRGYDCLVLRDCCASMSPAAHDATMVILGRGVFGSLSDSENFLKALDAAG